MDRGADPLMKDTDGLTARDWAERQGFSEIVHLIEPQNGGVNE